MILKLICRYLNSSDNSNKEQLSITFGDRYNEYHKNKFVQPISNPKQFIRASTVDKNTVQRKSALKLSDRDIMRKHILQRFAKNSNSPNYQFMNKVHNEYGCIVSQNQNQYNDYNKQTGKNINEYRPDSLSSIDSDMSVLKKNIKNPDHISRKEIPYNHLNSSSNMPGTRPPKPVKFSHQNQPVTSNINIKQNQFQKLKQNISHTNQINNQKKNFQKKNKQLIKITPEISIEIKFLNIPGINKGESKTNQDSVLINKFKSKNKTFYIFAVFDGHGKDGHFVSKFLKSNFANMLKLFCDREPGQTFNPYSMHKIISNCCNYLENQIKEIGSRKTSLQNSRVSYGSNSLKSSQNFDVNLSGSTCSMIILSNDMIWSVSLGDSKSILIFQNLISITNSLSYFPYPLSKIHSTDNFDEIRRVKKEGGLIKKATNYMYESYGPLRVWNSKGKLPGLQVTRSFGDLIGKGCGVSAVPEIINLKIKDNTKAMIIATDGLWDMVSEQESIDIIKDYGELKEIDKAIIHLRDNCMKKWSSVHKNMRRDDLSIILVYFHQNKN